MADREKLIELKDVQITFELKDLQISFGTGRKKFVAVDHVNFDIYKGETFSLVGESGSGKTTIGRAILRINPTSAGDIYFKGQKINGKIFPIAPILSAFCSYSTYACVEFLSRTYHSG